VRDAAVLEMTRVRTLFPRGQGQDSFDVTVEGFLLAAGVPTDSVAALRGSTVPGQQPLLTFPLTRRTRYPLRSSLKLLVVVCANRTHPVHRLRNLIGAKNTRTSPHP
jgi:hypothetical protein